MASVLKVNTLTGVTTAGSIDVTDGSTTTNLQQGLAKVRYSFDLNGGQNSFEGSFNCSSGSDDGTADATVTFTNAMADQDYTPVSSSADADICATPSDRTDGKGSRTTAAFKTRIRNHAGTGVDSIAYVALFGDLA